MLAETLEDQLFAHWPVPVATLHELVPAALEVDAFDASGWLGATPFEVKALRLRGLLPLPVVSSFTQLNVRTYVTQRGRPGIWFFSLDFSSPLAAEVARRVFRLPCFRAHVSLERREGRFLCECVRREGEAFGSSYRPAGPPASPEPGSLEHFLTERYCLYVEHRGRICDAEIHHRPWPLQPAEAAIDLNTMVPRGIRLEAEPLLHYSARQDVLVWPLAEGH